MPYEIAGPAPSSERDAGADRLFFSLAPGLLGPLARTCSIAPVMAPVARFRNL